jgi:hypothetical protein
MFVYRFCFVSRRTVAVWKEQEAHFYNKDLDPTGARHPMVKVQLLNIMEADRGKLLQLMNTTNDYVAEGVQEQSLPMKMMTVRKCLLGLTEKIGRGVPVRRKFQVVEVATQTKLSLKSMTGL